MQLFYNWIMNTISPSLHLIRDVKHRSFSPLMNTRRDARLVTIYSPSSFYVHLAEEDAIYKTFDGDMNDYYDIFPKYSYDDDEGENGTAVPRTPKPILKRFTLTDVPGNSYIAVKIGGKWGRFITDEENPCWVRSVDTGTTAKLDATHEKDGIYDLEERFLALPPRAILCAFACLAPFHDINSSSSSSSSSSTCSSTNSNKHKWKKKACQMVVDIVRGRTLKVTFVQKGLFHDSAHVLVGCSDTDGSFVHIGWLLVAFNLAVIENEGNLSPIWPTDTLC